MYCVFHLRGHSRNSEGAGVLTLASVSLLCTLYLTERRQVNTFAVRLMGWVVLFFFLVFACSSPTGYYNERNNTALSVLWKLAYH